MRNIVLLVSVAQICLLAGEAHAQTTPASPAGSDSIADVVVTADKRGATTLLRAPVPVAVLDTGQLAQNEQVKLQDFAGETPGFIVAPAAANQANLSIRGINTGGQGGAPTVGITLDDVPFASSGYQPELDPGDLERIEVLRGPQGTQYGANAMGGLLRFVTVLPSTSGFSGQVSAGVTGVVNGGRAGYSVRGSVNVPVNDTLAVRLSGFNRREPGFIRDTLSNVNAANEARAEGGRGALLWKPSSAFSLELTALRQTITNDADDEVNPALGDLVINSPRGATSSKITVQVFSGILNAQFGGLHLSSITGYNTLDNISRTDFSFSFGPILRARFGVQPYAETVTPGNLRVLSEELRLDTTLFKHLDVQVAGFYSFARQYGGLTITAPDPLTGQLLIPDAAFNTFASLTHRIEYAGFGSLTYHFTDRLQLQLGGRASHIEQTIFPYYRYGNFNTPNPLLVSTPTASSNPFTYLITPQFQITPTINLYGRVSSGFRQGGANTTPNTPPIYNPDKTYNYEIGFKGRFLDGKITTDLSLYYVNWKDIQIQLRTPTLLLYMGNGGQAKSEGVEATLAVKPYKGTSLSGWLDYDNAVLTSDFVNSPTYGRYGDRLPNTPKWSGHIAARQDIFFGDGITGYFEADANFIGDRTGIFQATALRQGYSSYTQGDLRAGLNFRSLSGTVYVNNIGDVRGALNGGIGFTNPNNYVYIRPRTVGLSVTAKF